MFAPIIW